jgi:hypothetical protein
MMDRRNFLKLFGGATTALATAGTTSYFFAPTHGWRHPAFADYDKPARHWHRGVGTWRLPSASWIIETDPLYPAELIKFHEEWNKRLGEPWTHVTRDRMRWLGVRQS